MASPFLLGKVILEVPMQFFSAEPSKLVRAFYFVALILIAED